MKVVKSDMSSGYSVVPNVYGTKMLAGDGSEFTKLPLPVCKVPSGYGRTEEEAYALAVTICYALTKASLLVAGD